MTLAIALSARRRPAGRGACLVGDGPDLAVGQRARAGARRDRRRPQSACRRPGSAPPWRRRCRRRGLAVGDDAPGRDSQLVLIGSIVIGAIFFIRGTAGYSARWRARFTAEPFRTRDFYLYSPLCLALGVGFIALLTREMH